MGLVISANPVLLYQHLWDGYAHVLQQHQAPLQTKFIFRNNDLTTEGGYQFASDLLQHNKILPRALFVINDSVAQGMIQRFNESGIDVPGDIAIIGFGDLTAQNVCRTNISSVCQPAQEKGEKATEMLLDLLRHPERLDSPHAEILKPTLEIRRSCGC